MHWSYQWLLGGALGLVGGLTFWAVAPESWSGLRQMALAFLLIAASTVAVFIGLAGVAGKQLSR